MEHTYTGRQDSALAAAMRACDPGAPVMVHITKQYPKADTSSFDAFGRVMSGTLQTGASVRVLGEGYTPEDEEDMTTKEVTKLWIYQARSAVPPATPCRGYQGASAPSCLMEVGGYSVHITSGGMRPGASSGSEHAVSLGSNARQRSFETACLRVNHWKRIATSSSRVNSCDTFQMPTGSSSSRQRGSRRSSSHGRPSFMAGPLVLRRVCGVAGTGWQ